MVVVFVVVLLMVPVLVVCATCIAACCSCCGCWRSRSAGGAFDAEGVRRCLCEAVEVQDATATAARTGSTVVW